MEESRIQMTGHSDPGKVRENQEDSWGIVEPATGTERRQSGRLLMVADGIGGSLAGEVASKLAVDVVREAYYGRSGDPRSRLRRAIQQANTRILEETERSPHMRGMGTTIVAGVILGDRVLIAWLGDSRAYLLRQKELLQITRDDSTSGRTGLVARSGGLNRWVGMGVMVDPSIREVVLQPGDRILICSDGLYNTVSNEEIIRGGSAPLERWVQDLIQLSLRHGAPDNVTIAAAHIHKLAFAPDRHPDPRPGETLDGYRITQQVGTDALCQWYLAEVAEGSRLLCILRPELQSDAGLILDLEEEEESLSRISHPAAAIAERVEAEKSLPYVSLRLPWAEDADGGRGLHSLQQVLEMVGLAAMAPQDALEIGLQVAGALSAVRSSLMLAGAPHPSDFWGDGIRYALCRWPGPRRRYCVLTGRGTQSSPMMQPYMPPDFGPDDIPGPSADAYFVGCVLNRLLGGAERALADPVQDLLFGLLSENARRRLDPLEAIPSTLRKLGS